MVAPARLDEDTAVKRVTPVDVILRAYAEGHAAVLITGRSLYDLVADEEGRLLTLVEHLRRRARAQHAMLTLSYSLAGGFDWDAPRLQDERDRRTIESALRAHGLLQVKTDEKEVLAVLRGVGSLGRTPTDGLAWADGTAMRFLFLLEFAEHLAPRGDQVGRTDQEIRAVELAHVLGQSNALRQSGNLVVFHGREGRIDQLVAEALHPIRLPQPELEEKRCFLNAARRIYPGATLEAGVLDDDVARLTTNTPNRGLESCLRASERRGSPVTIEELIEQKSRDVVTLSEHTLTLLDARRIVRLQLVGRNVEVPLRLLLEFGEGLLHGNPHIPANVILVGPPGTGKTDLALFAARRARASAYEIHSPKAGIVGETERRANLLATALADWTPNVAFVDEITEALPLQRTDFDGDSGASRAVMAALLTSLSDESRRGRSLLVATTNCPWRMGAAMRSRFTMIPVLSPLRVDYPAIVCAVASRIAPETSLTETDVVEAADLFYTKGASPREIRAELSLSLAGAGQLTPELVVHAARDVCPSTDRASAEFADLWAVRTCTSKRYFPWYGGSGGYPFPEYLEGIVDAATGEVNTDVLERRLEALRPNANV